MDAEFTYSCPSCGYESTITESLVGQNVVCPQCSSEFLVTPRETQQKPNLDAGFILPTKLPFFKSGRIKILEQRFGQLMEVPSGNFSEAAEDALNKTGIELGLGDGAGTKLAQEHFMAEFTLIQKRIESAMVMTDEDLTEIEQLKKKYNVTLTLTGIADMCRAIYLLETKKSLPPPLLSQLMLDAGETAYYSIVSTWHQNRVHSHGYSGTSVSVPSGIRGVRFRFGGYTPIRTEEMTPLSAGTLYVTSARLLFNGQSRNTSISLKKIVDGHVFSDCVRVEKSTGKPDFFSMDAIHARYVLSLIGALKG
jgi:DNA-directed RNA polymerase subunit RPC12/RpoP